MQFTDQLNRTINLDKIPQRIISLVPSQTEYLYDLGLGDRLIACTKFCIHPKELKKKIAVIGGTKTIDLAKIRTLQPDLIIGNKEENEQLQIEALMNEYPVWMSDIFDLDDAIQMMKSLGILLDCEAKGFEITNEIEQSFSEFKFPKSNNEVLYFIWKDPYMLASANTFINDLLNRIGLINLATLSDKQSRYPSFELDELKQLNPKCILLSSEPYPFKEKQLKEFQLSFPDAKILIVDGELFSWYGSRLKHSIPYFKSLLQELN